MKRYLKNLVALLLAFVLLLTTYIPVFSVTRAQESYNWGKRDVVATELSSDADRKSTRLNSSHVT